MVIFLATTFFSEIECAELHMCMLNIKVYVINELIDWLVYEACMISRLPCAACNN